jgi:hypothetical protein
MCFFHQAVEFGINHGLAAAKRNDWGAAIIYRFQAFFDRQHFVDGGFVFANAATAGASKIAGMQRFEHHHQRVLLCAAHLLIGQIPGHAGGQA